MDKAKKNHGGARKGAGRKRSIGLTNDIQKHCQLFITELLMNDAIKLKATKDLARTIGNSELDYLYIIESDNKYKIGYSSNFKARLKNYKTHLGVVNLIYVTKQNDCFELEAKIHEMYKNNNIMGEWFNLSNSDIINIIKYCSSKID